MLKYEADKKLDDALNFDVENASVELVMDYQR